MGAHKICENFEVVEVPTNGDWLDEQVIFDSLFNKKNEQKCIKMNTVKENESHS